MSKRFARIEAILRDALDPWATAIVARVEAGGELLYEGAYGATRRDALAQPVYVDTRFDLASLTKLFVSTFALQLAAQGRLSLDEPVVRWIAEWEGRPHAAITARMLLAHTSGMNSGADYRTLRDRNVADFALTRDLAAQPGERVIYSDLGMIALGVLLERIEGRSLGAIATQRIGSESLQFAPRVRERMSITATEEDSWRGRGFSTFVPVARHSVENSGGRRGLSTFCSVSRNAAAASRSKAKSPAPRTTPTGKPPQSPAE